MMLLIYGLIKVNSFHYVLSLVLKRDNLKKMKKFIFTNKMDMLQKINKKLILKVRSILPIHYFTISEIKI